MCVGGKGGRGKLSREEARVSGEGGVAAVLNVFQSFSYLDLCLPQLQSLMRDRNRGTDHRAAGRDRCASYMLFSHRPRWPLYCPSNRCIFASFGAMTGGFHTVSDGGAALLFSSCSSTVNLVSLSETMTRRSSHQPTRRAGRSWRCLHACCFSPGERGTLLSVRSFLLLLPERPRSPRRLPPTHVSRNSCEDCE